MNRLSEIIPDLCVVNMQPGRGYPRCLDEVFQKLLANNSFDQIDIPDDVFQSAEAKRCGFTKRSFLEAGWRKVK